MALKRLPHILLTIPPEGLPFTSAGAVVRGPCIPKRDRQGHSAFLRTQLQQALQEAKDERNEYRVTRRGVYIEFRGEQGYDLITKSLEAWRSPDVHKCVRLLNVRSDEHIRPNPETGEEERVPTISATVFVPNEKTDFFLRRIEAYAKEEVKSGKPKNAALVDSIAGIRKAVVPSFWQDAQDLVPGDEPEWCEVWLNEDTPEIVTRFETLLREQHIAARPGHISFPERVVKAVHVNRSQLERLTQRSDDIAEFRRAKEAAAFWMRLPNREQTEWVQDLLDRIHVHNETSAVVCILDTGVNNGHPLLAPILADDDCQSVNAEWGTYDHHRHGTCMAGVAAYGDLMACLFDRGPVNVRHRLESVKILPPGTKKNEPDLWGYITAQGISLAEIQAPERKRIVCMAVASDDSRDRGRPSSWSAALDRLASGVDNGGAHRRLVIIAAGNVTDPNNVADYPNAQLCDAIHDPGQSWNALTVGAYTALDTISERSLAGYRPIAPKSGLSPFTTTSLTWEDRWPNKPDVVLEGGNAADDGMGFGGGCDDLSLLSTSHDPQSGQFAAHSMTSAATAQAAWFAAQIQASYPTFWPETIRALMVHSAKWTPKLKEQFLKGESKTAMRKMLRIAGYGVPDRERALHSAANSLTLISQIEIQPFGKKDGSRHATKEMHLYELPWPKDVLLSLPDDTDVEMRVTLSYFIEPGPGEIGWKDRYRYASHGLRFEVKSPGESRDDFVKRINAAARAEEDERLHNIGTSSHWVLGKKARDKGSIHSDFWKGTAAELATSNLIGVFPTIGWWRERSNLGRWNSTARYSLVVSINTPEEDVDIYTPVAAQIGIAVPIVVEERRIEDRA